MDLILIILFFVSCLFTYATPLDSALRALSQNFEVTAENDCAIGTTSSVFSADTMTLSFRGLNASIGSGEQEGQKQMECRIAVKMRIDGVIGVESVVWRGQADIDSAVQVSFHNLYIFANSENEKVTLQENLEGPNHEQFMKQTPVPKVRPWQTGSTTWQSGLDNILLVRTAVSLSSIGEAKGAVLLNSIDVKFRRT